MNLSIADEMIFRQAASSICRLRRLRQATPNDGQIDIRRALCIVEDRLVGRSGFRLSSDVTARVGVAVPQREVAAGHMQADAMALAE